MLLVAPLDSARMLIRSGFFWKICLQRVSWLITREGEACLKKLDLVMGERLNCSRCADSNTTRTFVTRSNTVCCRRSVTVKKRRFFVG